MGDSRGELVVHFVNRSFHHVRNGEVVLGSSQPAIWPHYFRTHLSVFPSSFYCCVTRPTAASSDRICKCLCIILFRIFDSVVVGAVPVPHSDRFSRLFLAYAAPPYAFYFFVCVCVLFFVMLAVLLLFFCSVVAVAVAGDRFGCFRASVELQTINEATAHHRNAFRITFDSGATTILSVCATENNFLALAHFELFG